MENAVKDDKKLYTLFDEIAHDIVSTANHNPADHGYSKKLWRLPETIIYYYFDAVTEREKTQLLPDVMKFRQKSIEIIDKLPETKSHKEALNSRLNEALLHFKFRRWRENDLARYINLLDHEIMWRFFPEDYPNPLTEEAALSLIETSNSLPDRHSVDAIEWDGQIVGQARLLYDSHVPDSAEISYWLGQNYWGKGLASDFVALYTQYCFQNNDAISRIYAKVIMGNIASVKVLEKAGYQQESTEIRNVKKNGTSLNTQVLSVYRHSYQF